MVKNENFIMQAKESKTLQELNLTDDFLFDVATEELENCKTIIELSTGLRLKSLKWKSGQKVIHNLPGKRGIRLDLLQKRKMEEFLMWKCKIVMKGTFQSGPDSIRR